MSKTEQLKNIISHYMSNGIVDLEMLRNGSQLAVDRMFIEHTLSMNEYNELSEYIWKLYYKLKEGN